MADDAETLRDLVRALSDAWRAGRFDELRRYFHDDAVIVAPGFGARITGADAVIDTYRDFASGAITELLEIGDVVVDLFGDVAVVTAPFTIAYVMSGVRYHEQGHDLVVFRRAGGDWRIVWRTLVAGPASQRPE